MNERVVLENAYNEATELDTSNLPNIIREDIF
jgi:hypothetical protein